MLDIVIYMTPIVIVSYRNPVDVTACLDALVKMTKSPRFSVYICENGGKASFDELVSALKRLECICGEGGPPSPVDFESEVFVRVHYFATKRRQTSITVAEATENLGYGGAINAWLRVLLNIPSWPGIWVLNPDTRPEPDALAELVAWSSKRGKGMVGSSLVSVIPPEWVQTRGLRWRPLKAATEGVDKYASAATNPEADEVEARIDAPSGASIYVTRPCLEQIGLMDTDYFLFFEDLDWGYRAKPVCGVGYAHKSIVVHKGGTTIGSGTSRATASPLAVYLEFRNRVIFVRKHHPFSVGWTVFVLALRSLEYTAVGAFKNFYAAVLGLKAGIMGEVGRPDRQFDFDGGRPTFRRRGGLRLRSDGAGPGRAVNRQGR
jgi:N-acetylglucosaminyl-diphospho-decaprenol L-rhamnosyltransferase